MNKLPSCCQFHGLEEDGCNGGRDCTAGRVTPEDAAGWLIALLIGIVGFVTLGLIAAFVLTNWEALIHQIWPRLVYVASF